MRKIMAVALSFLMMVTSAVFASVNHVTSQIVFNKISIIDRTGQPINDMGQLCQTKYSGLRGKSMGIDVCVDAKNLHVIASATVLGVRNVSFSSQGRSGQYAFIHTGALPKSHVLRVLMAVSGDFQKATGILILRGGTISVLGKSRSYNCMLVGSGSTSHKVLKSKSGSTICSQLK